MSEDIRKKIYKAINNDKEISDSMLEMMYQPISIKYESKDKIVNFIVEKGNPFNCIAAILGMKQILTKEFNIPDILWDIIENTYIQKHVDIDIKKSNK